MLRNIVKHLLHVCRQDIDSGEREGCEGDSDDYESIEEVKERGHKDPGGWRLSEGEGEEWREGLEWRVLSRLEGEEELGEDWRIVTSMPRPRDRRVDKVKAEEECKHLPGLVTSNVNNVAGAEHEAVNTVNTAAASSLENLVTGNSEDGYRGSDEPLLPPTPPGCWLRKQVTFGELLVFSLNSFFRKGAKYSALVRTHWCGC